MDKVLLTGGDFGGQTVEVQKDQDVVEMVDGRGTVWRYDRARHADGGRAVAHLVSISIEGVVEE